MYDIVPIDLGIIDWIIDYWEWETKLTTTRITKWNS